jgi:Ca-activated chloride channel family protein
MLAREDFDNDKVDAGDVGSGQTVTALYEIVPVGGPRAIGDLRYSRPLARAEAGNSSEYGFRQDPLQAAELRPGASSSPPRSTALRARTFTEAPRDARFAAGVASFAELLAAGATADR